LLFVDTWHTGEQLAAELARHADKVARIMAFHDTQSFGEIGEDGTSRGLRPALDEFLAAHDEWYLAEEYRHENGLTVLRRVDDGSAGSETQHKKVERQMPEKIQNPEFQI
jgi:hypothetical protein